MSLPNAATLLQLAQIGLLARKTVETRIALFRLQARTRARAAAFGTILAMVAAVFLLCALGLVLAAIVWSLHLSGFGWPAALLTTAIGTTVLGLLLGLAARSALIRAVHD